MSVVLEELVSRVLGVPEPSLAKLSRGDGPWDSLAHLDVIRALEEAYSVRLTTREMLALGDLASLRRVLEAKGAQP